MKAERERFIRSVGSDARTPYCETDPGMKYVCGGTMGLESTGDTVREGKEAVAGWMYNIERGQVRRLDTPSSCM